MKAYKAFNKDLTSICGRYQYREGEKHSQNDSTFFAAEDPYFCLRFGRPENGCEYREVELSGITTTSGIQDDRGWDYTEATGQNITIGRKVSVEEMLWISHLYRLGWTSEEVSGEADGERCCAVTDSRHRNAVAKGDKSVALARTVRSSAVAEGRRCSACAEGRGSSATVRGAEGLAIALGPDSCAAAAEDCWLLLTDRNDYEGQSFPKTVAVHVDGKKIKANVYYRLLRGKIVPAAGQPKPIKSSKI